MIYLMTAKLLFLMSGMSLQFLLLKFTLLNICDYFCLKIVQVLLVSDCHILFVQIFACKNHL